MLRKPITVERLVRKTGVTLTRRLSTMASFLDRPDCMPFNIVTRIWMLSAMARVMMIVGA